LARRARVTGILGSPGKDKWGSERAIATSGGSRRQVSVARYVHGTHRLATSASSTHRQLLVYVLDRAAEDNVCCGLRQRHHAGRITSAGGLRVCRRISAGSGCPARSANFDWSASTRTSLFLWLQISGGKWKLRFAYICASTPRSSGGRFPSESKQINLLASTRAIGVHLNVAGPLVYKAWLPAAAASAPRFRQP
jgi:hypothetical protein